MNQVIQLSLPIFEELDDGSLTTYAAEGLGEMETEAREAQSLSERAFQRAWAVGKACVVLKERIGAENWENYARENIHRDYMPIYRCMRLARMDPQKPPLRGSLQYKQLMIALGDEAAPKATPRKTDHHSLINFKAANLALKRWWKDGGVLESMDVETIRAVKEDVEWMEGFLRTIDEALESR
jgi:hypothetical protein